MSSSQPDDDRSLRLVLADGSSYCGTGFGARCAVGGEVVFNTAMTGYVETLTDPSYRGQILVLTYPLLGNYGVPATRARGSLAGPFESGRIQVQGLVVQGYVPDYSHHDAAGSLGAWLSVEGIPAVCGIDTRALTRKLREHGTMQGWLLPAGRDPEQAMPHAHRVEMRREVFRAVTPQAIERFPGEGPRILAVDTGMKDNIVRSLLSRGAAVVRAPHDCDLLALAQEADGIVIGNGPGDPRDLDALAGTIGELLRCYTRPVFGICLGHQLLGLAAGAGIYKLPYGHRGVNQPVQDLRTRKCYITSQNHGYAIRGQSLPQDWEPWFVNLNDGTIEGIRALDRPFFGVQFHPEAHPGPADTAYLFDEYLARVRALTRR